MTQELIDLRNSILEGRYEDALEMVDELEGMSKQAILRNIQSFLLRLLTHLIKNHVEKRLTNSRATSISDSIRQIKKLNLKDNQTSYYLKSDEWQELIEDEMEAAIDLASVEVFAGAYSRFQLADMVDKDRVREIAQDLLALTYSNSVKELSSIVNEYLTTLPGGEDWKESKQR